MQPVAAQLLESFIGAGTNMGRLYGPRVYTNKNIGRHHGMKWGVVGSDTEDVRRDAATGRTRKRLVITMSPVAASSKYMPHQSVRQAARYARQSGAGDAA